MSFNPNSRKALFEKIKSQAPSVNPHRISKPRLNTFGAPPMPPALKETNPYASSNPNRFRSIKKIMGSKF